MTAEIPVLRRDRRDHRRSRGRKEGQERPEKQGDPSSALVPKLLIGAVFAVPFAWDLVKAVANLSALLAFADGAGHPLNSYAWLVLGAGILAPIVAFTAGLLFGWTRGPLRLAAALGVALAATAAISLTLEALLRA